MLNTTCHIFPLSPTHPNLTPEVVTPFNKQFNFWASLIKKKKDLTPRNIHKIIYYSGRLNKSYISI